MNFVGQKVNDFILYLNENDQKYRPYRLNFYFSNYIEPWRVRYCVLPEHNSPQFIVYETIQDVKFDEENKEIQIYINGPYKG